jgi:hypothetical protein
MDETTALHTAARGYCEARFSEWIQVYEDLQRTENWQVKKLLKERHYSEEAYHAQNSQKYSGEIADCVLIQERPC